MEALEAARGKKAGLGTAIILGADITVAQWLFWNQLPVTLGIVGGALLTGLLLHYANPDNDAAADARDVPRDGIAPEGLPTP